MRSTDIWGLRAGLEHLCRLDHRFKSFKDRLFARSALTLNRDQLSADENDKVSAILQEFLQTLANYFLTPAAFQVLEFLVRRYQ